MAAGKSYTGRVHDRRSRRLVRFTDGLARLVITIGGVGTIVAVSTVFFFLLYVVFPLFRPTHVLMRQAVIEPRAPIVHLAMDDDLRAAATVSKDGATQMVRLDDGRLLSLPPIASGGPPTAIRFSPRGDAFVAGFADGSFRLGRIELQRRPLRDAEKTVLTQAPPSSAPIDVPNGLIIPGDRPEWLGVVTTLGATHRPMGASEIRLIDFSEKASGVVVALLNADQKLAVAIEQRKRNLVTGKTVSTWKTISIPFTSSPDSGEPRHLLVSGLGDSVDLAWEDGRLVRFSVDAQQLKMVETLNLVGAQGGNLTALEYLVGKTTLVSGDSNGRVRAWFPIRPNQSPADGGNGASRDTRLVCGHEFHSRSSGVRRLAPSPRTRMLAAGYDDGAIDLFLVTTDQLLNTTRLYGDQPVLALALSNRNEGLVAQSATSLGVWSIDSPHPEASLRSLFFPVWYEGHSGPAHVWQSSGGSDDFEPKLGLWPLVYGTAKATFYSMLFGVPLALLGAIYTSEFLSPRAKARIKPTIELMASLPSVVLGFLAAFVVAPYVEQIVPAVIASFLLVPFTFLLMAHLFQLLPRGVVTRMGRARFMFILATLPVGIGLSFLAGPWIERLLFSGDLRAWLDGQVGGATGGWFFLLTPFTALAAATLVVRVVHPLLRSQAEGWSRRRWASLSLVVFLMGVLLTLLTAASLAWLLTSLGWDSRGMIVSTYVQRNALVVGFVMGFAVIPIIYTIAEDALATVPEHLRSASLGAGATPWQTATRVIIPTAMSGLFSAVMVGLGRAVGETMIVLMAAGNTPIMDFNIFDGFRTLSANLAVELPEAVPGGTHYRTLFLAALTLFVFTFILNTIAEMVRQRFRRRAYQL